MKTEQLQIRVSPEVKAAIRKRAKAADMEMSEWVLATLFPPAAREFQRLVSEVAKHSKSPSRSYPFASLSDFLQELEPDTLVQATADGPQGELDEFVFNYIAAMIEQACYRKEISPPAWTKDAVGLSFPYFGSSMPSLQLYLLTHAPVPFKKRNIFIDSSIGDRL